MADMCLTSTRALTLDAPRGAAEALVRKRSCSRSRSSFVPLLSVRGKTFRTTFAIEPAWVHVTLRNASPTDSPQTPFGSPFHRGATQARKLPQSTPSEGAAAPDHPANEREESRDERLTGSAEVVGGVDQRDLDPVVQRWAGACQQHPREPLPARRHEPQQERDDGEHSQRKSVIAGHPLVLPNSRLTQVG